MSENREIILKKNLEKYLKSTRRTSQLLDFMFNLFTGITAKVYFLNNKICKLLNRKKNPIDILKLLVLLDRFLLVIEAIEIKDMTTLVKGLNDITIKQTDGFDQFISKRIITPYKLYLQKRIIDLSSQQNPTKIKIITEDLQTTIINSTYHLSQCQRIINLFNYGLQFHEAIFILGRYYSSKCKFLIDFNITLGIVFREFYEKLKINFTNLDENQVTYPKIVKQIEQIHEKLNSIYLNIYHYQHMKYYMTSRIPTQNIDLNKKMYRSGQKKTIDNNYIFSVNTTAEKTISMNQNSLDQKLKSKLKSKQKIQQFTTLNQMEKVISEFSIEVQQNWSPQLTKKSDNSTEKGSFEISTNHDIDISYDLSQDQQRKQEQQIQVDEFFYIPGELVEDV